jgi:HlyD family secretion protein
VITASDITSKVRSIGRAATGLAPIASRWMQAVLVRFPPLSRSVRTTRVPRRALIALALAAAVAIVISLSVGQLQSAPAASESGASAKASKGDVVLSVGGVGRIVQAGRSAEIAVPAAAGGAAAPASAGSASSAAAAATSASAVFPQATGHLARFLVARGQRVAAGQALALLDDRGSAAAAVAQARNDVAMALVDLRQKRTSDPLRGLPPTSAELAAARGAVTTARLRLARLLRGPRPADVSAARLDVKRAEADVETLLGGSPQAHADAILIAQHNVQLAQERLDRILAPPSAADVAVAQADVRRAESDLAVLSKPAVVGTVPEEITAARAALDAARQKLARLLAPPSPADVTAARLDLERAQAELRRLEAGPSPAALAAARQALHTARARLNQLLGPPLPSDVAAARQEVFRAEADLAVLRARGGPASPLDVALARLKVVAAQLRLASARVSEPLLTVRAPSSGTVTALLTVPGAPVDPSTPIAAVADLARLAVDVDLSEFDVARVKPGLRAVVSVDALGGESFSGKVRFAALTGTNTGGVVTYPVRVGIAHADGLRPGMNVSVRIIVAKRLGVLQLPLEAVTRDEEDRATVTVIDAAGETSLRRVTLGLASNDNVEIVKGLRAGERVALPESQTQAEGD